MIEFGKTGAWISSIMRIEFSPFHSENGCLDAPELLLAGSTRQARKENGEIFAAQNIFIRSE